MYIIKGVLHRHEIAYREVSLQTYFVIVYDRSWPALKYKHILVFLIKRFEKKQNLDHFSWLVN